MIGYTFGIGYIISDIGYATYKSYPKDKLGTFVDKVGFHALASFLLPGLCIDQIIDRTNNAIRNKNLRSHFRFIKITPRNLLRLPGIVGLISIPIIIVPIDYIAEKVVKKANELYNDLRN